MKKPHCRTQAGVRQYNAIISTNAEAGIQDSKATITVSANEESLRAVTMHSAM